MDTFMDKLAQKLNAQEMIRANSAADAEELGKLKNQVQEYNACLVKLQKLLDEGVRKIEGAKVDGAEINRLVEEGIAKINAIQKDAEGVESLKALIDELSATLEGMEGSLEIVENSMELVETSMADQKAVLETKLADVNENIHKECVKVYRNVQAVVVEENGKQTEALSNAVSASWGKMKAVLGISVAALVVSVASVVLQILNMMNFKLF